MGAAFATDTASTAFASTVFPAKRKQLAEPIQPDWDAVDSSWSDFSPSGHKELFADEEYTASVPSHVTESYPSHHSFASKALWQAIVFTLGPVMVGQPTAIPTREHIAAKPSGIVMSRRDIAGIDAEQAEDTVAWRVLISPELTVPTQIYEVEEWKQSLPATADFLAPNVIREAHSKLIQLRAYEDGWHEPRSLGANEQSFSMAEGFLVLISESESIISIEPTIFSLGTAALEIETDDASMLLEFLSDGTILANIDDAEGEKDFDLKYFSGTSVPSQIARYF
jgi:hypothetical protein